MFVLIVALIGLMIGPWISATVDAVPDYSGGGREFNTCRECGAGHGWARFVPLVGHRSCRQCSTSMRRTSVVVELLTPIMFAGAASIVGRELEIIPILGFLAALIALSAVDIERYRLPDRLLFPSLFVLAAVVVVVSFASDAEGHLVPALVGALAYFVALLLPNLISPGGLAFGDVKLALLLGLFLGWVRSSVLEGVVLVIWALLLGMVLGTVSGLLVGVARRIWGPGFLPDPDIPDEARGQRVPILKTQFPFGPALAVAAVAVVLLSGSIIGTPGLL